ncbi:MAG: marine proteobacterial sortase target protein [bacterium]|nr:marine proteobacterial sortase target protein [bacterium]
MKAKNLLVVLLILSFSFSIISVFSEPADQALSSMAGIMMGYTQEGKEPVYLPLKRTDVKLDLTGTILKAEVTQIFTNDTPDTLEAVYVFPLPSNATISDMEMKIGERIIKSIVKEREEAKKIYEEAKAEGKKTALVEQERPNIFTTSVANFLPGETVEIKLSYYESVEFHEGVVSVVFPMVIGQRYVPFKVVEDDNNMLALTTEVEDWDRINPPLVNHPNLDPEHRASITLNINGLPVKDIKSTTHEIVFNSASEDSETYVVNLKEELTRPDCEFAVEINLQEESTPQITMVNSFNEDYTHNLLSIFPPFKSEDIKVPEIPKEVVFLIDTSGSMDGTSIQQAKNGLLECLNILKSNDTFTIVRFASSYSAFTGSPVPATKENLASARLYVKSLQAGGGTEMQPALNYVLNMLNADMLSKRIGGSGKLVEKLDEDTGKLKMIIFLTDGDVGNEDSLFKLLSSKLVRTRLFTFGIGSAPNEYLMKRMAAIGRGQARFIRDTMDIGIVMSDFFKTLESPVLTDIRLAWEDDSGNPVHTIKTFPEQCPDVFYARPLQIIAKYPSSFSGKLRVLGNLHGKKVEYEYLISDSEHNSYPAIDKIYAKAQVDNLMYQMIQNSSYQNTEKIKNEIIQIALEYQLVTNYTSRVAVEEKISRDPNGNLVSVKVPVELPKGWNPNAWYPGSTATNDVRNFIVGFAIIILSSLILILSVRIAKNEKKQN